MSCTGPLAATLGVLNPLRYRGYVYDEETGWYYLQSRYYDPEVGRFLSADVYLSTGQGVLGCNAYCYCRNNPINCADPRGLYISPEDGTEVFQIYIELIYTATPEAASILKFAQVNGASFAAQRMIARAANVLGFPYPKNGEKPLRGKTYDCASLVDEACNVGSSCRKLFDEHEPNLWDFNTTYQSIEEALPFMVPGDLIYWGSKIDRNHGHVALYIGRGMIIDSTRSGGGAAYRHYSEFLELDNNAETHYYRGFAHYSGD